ncbi:MAG: hypothetical protein DMG06_04435 [Acidobacteria bacterium]|nr:MAG: hypothetical protein DMG06_04435 [Acidobacteriota bacterium]
MSIVVREADLEKDQQILIWFLQQHLTKQSDHRRFDWLYRNNPHGAAQAWIATDREKEIIVGMASAFPRRFYIGGKEERGVVLGDFCISDQYRSLGPALQLQRACLTSVDGKNKTFGYDFPSQSMISVYKRLNVKAAGQMVRLAKPLRVDRKVKKTVKVNALYQPLTEAGNAVLSLLDRRFKQSSSASTIGLHQGVCGEEFTSLAQEVGSRYGACVQRSADYLNWRYLAHPLYSYELVTARRAGTLQAYAAFSETDRDAFLVDLFGIDASIIRDLAGKLVDLLRQRGVVTLSAPMMDSHPWVGVLQDLGFRKREASPVVIYLPSSQLSKSVLVESANWSLVDGDRDS